MRPKAEARARTSASVRSVESPDKFGFDYAAIPDKSADEDDENITPQKLQLRGDVEHKTRLFPGVDRTEMSENQSSFARLDCKTVGQRGRGKLIRARNICRDRHEAGRKRCPTEETSRKLRSNVRRGEQNGLRK